MTKNEIRILIKNKRNQLSNSKKSELDSKIQDRLYAFEPFKACDYLFTYVSFGSEADTLAVIDTSLRMGKRVFIPKVEGTEMNFYEIRSFDGLIKSKFGILEPMGIEKPYLPSENQNEKKIMLLPGLAFDKTGNRIGYGAGYYDRYLGKYPQDEWLKIGLAYNFQIFETLPASAEDIKTDYIITDDMLIICKQDLYDGNALM